jgi:5'-nucleotidase/UDP-sugar diphosphatase
MSSLALVLGLFLLVACPGGPGGSGSADAGSPDGPPAKAAATLVLIHTNDWHGYALPDTPPDQGGKGAARTPAGGLVAMAAAVAEARKELGDRLLVLDAGDLLTGHPASGVEMDGVQGGAFVKAWSAIGWDGWVIGNHDFDAGLANARGMVKLVKAPMICANLFKAGTNEPLFEGCAPYKIFERAGLKIGVIGIAPPDLARLTSAETIAGIKVVAAAEAAKPLAEKLEKECDLVVALTHEGDDFDRELAKAVPQLDLIVGGHSHKKLSPPVVEGGTIIVQAGAHGREYGRLELEVAGGKIVKHKESFLKAAAEGVTATGEMAAPMAKIQERLAVLDAEVLGSTTRGLKRGDYYRETQMGSFVADALKDAAGVDVGVMNSGGVRAELPKGSVTRVDLMKAFPNDNDLAVFTATGAEIEQLCKHNALAAVTHDHGILQVGGLRYRWKKAGEKDAELLSVEVGGKKLEKDKTYRVVSSEFIAIEQAQKYFGFVPKGVKKIDKTVHQAVIEALKKGPIELPDRGRMWEERPKKGAPAPAPGGEKGEEDGD